MASPALPGAVHDVRATREHGIVDTLAETDIKCRGRQGPSKYLFFTEVGILLGAYFGIPAPSV